MATITEFDFPCGCHTGRFDPRVWELCERHTTAQHAIFEWAAEGARLYRELERLIPPHDFNIQLKSAA